MDSWQCEHCLITARCAGSSPHRPARIDEFFRENPSRYTRGEPLLNVVDKQRGS